MELVRFAPSWNSGILERWNNGVWKNGFGGCFSLYEKSSRYWLEKETNLEKTNIPIFHSSSIPIRGSLIVPIEILKFRLSR